MNSSAGPPKLGPWAAEIEASAALAWSLLSRPDAPAEGEAALRAKYPDAPPEMIKAAAFHLYVDGPYAVIDWLAEAERAIRDPTHVVDFGASYHLLYHVYNWLQVRALLPKGTKGLAELVQEAKVALGEGDTESVAATLEELARALSASDSPPDVE